jgi:hypothetical protein
MGPAGVVGLAPALGADHPHTLICTGDLTLFDLGRETKAVAVRAKILVGYEDTFDAGHPAFLHRRRVHVERSSRVATATGRRR